MYKAGNRNFFLFPFFLGFFFLFALRFFFLEATSGEVKGLRLILTPGGFWRTLEVPSIKPRLTSGKANALLALLPLWPQEAKFSL